MRMACSEYGEWRDCIAQDWMHYLSAQEIDPVLVPNHPETCTSYLENVSGLILSGGNDVVLSSREDTSDDPVAVRDRTELSLLDAAIEKGLPILGVCRGLQFLNIAFGGSNEPVADHVGPGHIATHHTIHIDALQGQTLFEAGDLRVNSYHGTALAELGEGLKSFAESEDGLIEGVMHSSHNITGVMWHPERDFDNEEAVAAHGDLVKRWITSHT